MARLVNYQEIIKNVLSAYVEQFASQADDPVETLKIFDDERGQYLIMDNGWEGKKRIQKVPLFVLLVDGKVWIEEDWTEYGLVDRLLEEGVKHEDIVLAFHHPSLRPYTEFAAG